MLETKELVALIAKTLDEKKAFDLLALDVKGLTVICDAMVIASGRNANQVRSLAEAVDERMILEGQHLRRSDGMRDGHWIVLDYGDIMVHLFRQEERDYYRLERLWDDGTNRIPLAIDLEET